MLIKPVFNQNTKRPYRWALKLVEVGDVIEQYWVETDNYTYAIDKVTQTKRDVYTFYPGEMSTANFRPMRKRHIGFLTARHRDFFEDGKYVEVLNDPVNYISIDAINYGEAYTQAEQRIGNYRIGARRHITHLGGTFSDDQLENLSSIEAADYPPIATLSFPFFPPKPTDYTKAERINLLATDAGYVNYLKSIHPSVENNETFLAEQGNGFRRFIWAADTQTTHATTLNSEPRVDVQDIETVLNSAVHTATSGAIGDATSDKFLPVSGEDITINLPGHHILRSNSSGFKIEMYDDIAFSTLITSVDVPISGNMVLTSGNASITMTNSNGNIVLTNGGSGRTITMNGTTVDVT